MKQTEMRTKILNVLMQNYTRNLFSSFHREQLANALVSEISGKPFTSDGVSDVGVVETVRTGGKPINTPDEILKEKERARKAAAQETQNIRRADKKSGKKVEVSTDTKPPISKKTPSTEDIKKVEEFEKKRFKEREEQKIERAAQQQIKSEEKIKEMEKEAERRKALIDKKAAELKAQKGNKKVKKQAPRPVNKNKVTGGLKSLKNK